MKQSLGSINEQNCEPSPKALQKLEKYEQIRQKLWGFFFEKTPLKVSNMQTTSAYTDIYMIINNNHDRFFEKKKYESYEKTYLKVYQKDISSFANRCQEIIKKSQNLPCEDYIEYVQGWVNNFTRFVHWTFKSFSVIEKNSLHVKGTNLMFEALSILKKNLIEPIYETLFAAIFEALELYKAGELKSISNLQEIIRVVGSVGLRKYLYIALEKQSEKFVFVSKFKDKVVKEHNQTPQNPLDTDYFKKYFTIKLVKTLKQKYTQVSEDLIKLSAPEYVEKALKSLSLEEKTADIFYPSSSVKSLVIRSLDEVLAHNKAEELISKPTGLFHMLENKEFVQAKNLLRLIKRSSHFKLFTKEYQRFIEVKGNQILDKVTIEDERSAKKQVVNQMIEDLYDLYELMECISSQVANSDTEIQSSQTYGFQQICNKSDKVCNFLAYYADNMLRKEEDSLKESSDLPTKISKISKNLYSYDAFIKLYQKLLGLRMLFDTFRKKDLEVAIVNLLKNEAGISSVNKISCMMSDYLFSDSFNNEKSEVLKNQIGFKMEVSVLTSGSWQIHDSNVGNKAVPKALLQATDSFEKLYNQKLPDRKLTWVFNYGRAIALVHFDEAKHLLILNNYQLCMLLEFQRLGFASAKLGQLLESLAVEDEPAFNASLMMLVKAKILLKEGNPARIESKSEKVTFNRKFKHQTLKVRCFQLPRYIEKGSSQSSQLVIERSHLVDAAIVKLMKSKRVVPYAELISEVQKMCKTFKADIGLIKKRIENCQERDFLERDPNDMNTLIYMP